MTGEVALAPWTIVLVDTWMWAPYVMLICLAGLRSIPDYIYEAAEVDRASAWRQFWSITLPMVMPFLMLAVLFRAIENFKMFDMVNLLTSGGPGSTTELVSITLKRDAFEKWRTGYSSALRHHSLRHRLWRGEHLRQGAQPGEAAMSAIAKSAAHSIVESSPRAKAFAGAIVILYAVVAILPLLWIAATAFNRRATQSPIRQSVLRADARGICQSVHCALAADAGFHRHPAAGDDLVRQACAQHDMVIAGPSKVVPRFINSLVIGFGSTFLAVAWAHLPPMPFRGFAFRWPTICCSSSCRRG